VPNKNETRYQSGLDRRKPREEQSFLFVYDLGPYWQVENIFRGTYAVITPKTDNCDGAPGKWTHKIRMKIPEQMKKKGYRWCDDIVKVLITSQPTSFDLLELPDSAS
jgi:hypothetical protein